MKYIKLYESNQYYHEVDYNEFKKFLYTISISVDNNFTNEEHKILENFVGYSRTKLGYKVVIRVDNDFFPWNADKVIEIYKLADEWYIINLITTTYKY